MTADGTDTRSIVWLDIDNTLYSASHKVADLMRERIQAYFGSLGLAKGSGNDLAEHYYTEYGLAIRGLIAHHQIDPLDFDAKCDQSLPLEQVLKPDPRTRKLLEDFDRSKTRVWALTNAYINHAKRVLKILQLDDLVEEIVYCDYLQPNFSCKPEPKFYHDALVEAKVTDPSTCYFVDDSLKNVRAAKNLGWGSSIYFRESPTDNPYESGLALQTRVEGVDATIRSLDELRGLWPHLFKATSHHEGL